MSETNKKILKAVFPVAGVGTRFLPITKAQPKEMLPLVDKPILQYSVEEARAAGITDMIMVVSDGKESIKNHFKSNPDLEEYLAKKGKTDELEAVRKISDLGNFHYVNQAEPKGLGHAILQAKEAVGNEYFAVFYPDDIIDAENPCMKQMTSLFEELQAPIIAVMKTDAEGQKRFGIVGVDSSNPLGANPRVYKVTGIEEKPGPERASSNLASMGRLILPPEIFAELERTPEGIGGEIQLVDAICGLLENKEIYAYEFEGDYLDCGQILPYLKATIKLAAKHPKYGEEISNFAKEIS